MSAVAELREQRAENALVVRRRRGTAVVLRGRHAEVEEDVGGPTLRVRFVRSNGELCARSTRVRREEVCVPVVLGDETKDDPPLRNQRCGCGEPAAVWRWHSVTYRVASGDATISGTSVNPVGHLCEVHAGKTAA